MTKSYIPVVKALIKIDVHVGQVNVANESKARMKCGRPVGSKDKIFEKKWAKNLDGQIKDTITLEKSFEHSPVLTNISITKVT